MKFIGQLYIALLAMTLSVDAFGKSEPNCFETTRAKAEKLLTIQAVSDYPGEVEPKVRQLAPIKNPMGKGKFAVEEIWGGVYKARYRMRFLYLLPLTECALVGQEIVEML